MALFIRRIKKFYNRNYKTGYKKGEKGENLKKENNKNIAYYECYQNGHMKDNYCKVVNDKKYSTKAMIASSWSDSEDSLGPKGDGIDVANVCFIIDDLDVDVGDTHLTNTNSDVAETSSPASSLDVEVKLTSLSNNELEIVIYELIVQVKRMGDLVKTLRKKWEDLENEKASLHLEFRKLLESQTFEEGTLKVLEKKHGKLNDDVELLKSQKDNYLNHHNTC